MKAPKLTGSIAYGDDGRVYSFIETEAGQVSELASIAIDLRAPVATAKRKAGDDLRVKTADALDALADSFRNGSITTDL